MKNVTGASDRVYFLDWIRVLAMIGIFFFHNARFYDQFGDWHVRNATTGFGASVIVAFLSQFIMPLFFLVAGAGVYYALRSRRAGQFIRERSLRLLVPLIFGMLIIVVPQAYYEAVSHGENLSGYNIFQIYWLYLQTLPDLNFFHLWFLVDLFLFSLIALPLFLSGRGKKSLVSRLALQLQNPWLLLPILILTITLVNTFVFPDGFWGYRNGGWNIITYLLFFIFGYLLFADTRIIEWIKKWRWLFLGAAVIALASYIGLFYDKLTDPPETHFGTSWFALAHFIQAVSTWGWLLAILGFAGRHLNKTNRFLIYANEAVLPFYILHQTVIIIIGYYVVGWNSGVGLKYLVISISSFISIMAIYELLVRRINILRFLFGMRWRRKPQAAAVGTGQE